MTRDAAGLDVRTMSGFALLKAMMSGDVACVGIHRTLDFTAVSLEPGRVVFEGRPDERCLNPAGQVHGGYSAVLLDSAMACAVHSQLAAGQSYVTLEFKVAFHKPLHADGGVVRSVGTVLSMGRRVAYAEARLTDSGGMLLASATSTLLIDKPAARRASADEGSYYIVD